MSDQPGCNCSICEKDYMIDNLRARIIAAIAKADQDWCSDNPLHEDMADAVIRELELSIEHHKTYTGGDLRYLTIEGHFNEPI